MKEKLKFIIVIILFIFVLYIAVVNFIFQVMHPEITQMKAFLHLPRTILLDFNK